METVPGLLKDTGRACLLLPSKVFLNKTDEFQSRLRSGKAFGLMLGNYRVLDRLGAGGMGVIYLAEHTRMRKRVAVKTLVWSNDQDARLLTLPGLSG